MSEINASEEIIQLMKKAWETSPSVIISTLDYIYVLFPSENGKWIEASYMIKEKEIETRTIDSEQALKYLIEELTKGMPGYIPEIKNVLVLDENKFNEIINFIKQ